MWDGAAASPPARRDATTLSNKNNSIQLVPRNHNSHSGCLGKPCKWLQNNNTHTHCSWDDPSEIHATPPLWKNSPPVQRERAPSGPYGGGPYKVLGMQHKARLATRPPSSPLRYQLCHMGPFLAGEPLADVTFVLRGPPVKGEARHV